MELCGRKIMLYVWGNHWWIIHFKFSKHNQRLNADLYSQQLPRVNENLRKCPTLINRWNIKSASSYLAREKFGFRLVCSILSTIVTRPHIKWFPPFSFTSKGSEWWIFFQEDYVKMFEEYLLPKLKTRRILLEMN